jgi:arabinogalactan oligomer / maltooligosaccharide transport system substrate-binding protein
MFMNRSKVMLLVVFALLVALTGIVPVLAQDTPLVIWADAERAPLLTELGAQFEEEFGIPVEVQQYGLGDARDQLLIAGPAGEGPDIMVTAHDSIGQYVANGAIVPIELDEDTRALFTESSLNLFTYQDQLWGIPYAQENVALIRNVDLVPEAPATWEEVRTIAEELQSSGEAEYGLVIQTGNTYHNFPVTSAFGGYIFGQNEDGSFDLSDVGLSSEGGIAAAEWLSGMYNDGLLPTDVTDDVAFELFTAGEAAMIVTGPWFSTRIDEAAEAGGFEYSVDPLPVAENGSEVSQPFSGGQGFVISAFSDQQLEAETFLLDFVATADFMQAIFDQGGRPPAFVEVDTSSDPNVELFNVAGENAIPMPAVPEMGAVWAASDAALTSISLGEDPVTAMETAAQAVIDAIGRMNSEVRTATLVGSLQDEAGCDAEWVPECEVTLLNDDDGDGVYEGTFSLPAGDYEYKVAINGSWAESYGLDGGADNIPLSLSEDTDVTFTYDDSTNVVTDSVNNP